MTKPSTEYHKISVRTSAQQRKTSASALDWKVPSIINGSISQYECTADGFSVETPLGEKFYAKFDGKDYPVEDDPGGTMVSAKLISPDSVELTSKRNGKVVAIKQMSVAPGGRLIHVVFKNGQGDTVTTFDLKKQP